MKYYNRACEQKLSLALDVVGLWYKNGTGLFPQDMSKAVHMLKEARDMGQCNSMANLARLYYFKIPGMMVDAFELFERSAEYGNYKSMFTVAQMGVGDKGKKYLRTLVEKGWNIELHHARVIFHFVLCVVLCCFDSVFLHPLNQPSVFIPTLFIFHFPDHRSLILVSGLE